MTDEMMTLRSMLEKGTDADVLREMIGFAAERLMELEVQALTGAGHGERAPGRLTQRNGYRERDRETRSGTRIERLNGEIKRRTEVVGIFPNEEAITRLIGAILLEQNDEWAVQRARYMTLEAMAALGDDAVVSLPAVAA